MDGSFGKQKLKDYVISVQPILNKFLDEEIEKAKEFGSADVKLMESYKKMVLSGKGIRGFLITLGYDISGGLYKEKVLELSTFIELYHTAILIMDDFMDRDDSRRGLESVHKEFSRYGGEIKVKIPNDHFGNSMAVDLGIIGFYVSWKKFFQSDFEQSYLMDAAKIFSDFSVRLGLGQSLDLSITGKSDVTEEDILKVLWLKSGEYTALLPLRVGAALAGQKDHKKLDALDSYAKCLGWAFQIQDDLLGTFGDEEILGKPVGSDFKEGKNTLLILHLRKNGTAGQKDFQKNLLGNPNITKDDVKKMQSILIDCGAREYVYNLGMSYIEEGKKLIPQITDDKELQQTLESLLVYMMERVK